LSKRSKSAKTPLKNPSTRSDSECSASGVQALKQCLWDVSL
ncbi:hypothetical protein A2U01_0112644, partial [Trifolium medium]|nr:hypothetical protein [Trifolium medium]